MFSISGDVGIGVLKLAGERRDLRLRPAAVLVARNEDGPPREIGRHLEKVYLAAIRRERWVRFIVASGNDAGRKQRRMRERLRRIVRAVCATNDVLTIVRVIAQVRAKGSGLIAWYVLVMSLPVFSR